MKTGRPVADVLWEEHPDMSVPLWKSHIRGFQGVQGGAGDSAP